ncbi:MAG: hypothetical protein V1725_05740 [archaeon]
MTTRIEQDIVHVFARDLTRSYSIHQLSKELHKQYPSIHRTATRMIREGILTKNVIGRSFLCSLNFHEPQAALLFAQAELQQRNAFFSARENKNSNLLKTLNLLTKQLPIKLILHVHNSYYVVVPEETKRQLHFLPNTVVLLTREEFQTKLLNDTALLKEKTVIYSFESYAEMIADVQDQIRVKWLLEGKHA